MSTYFHRFFRTGLLLLAVLLVGVTAPVLAADKKTDGKKAELPDLTGQVTQSYTADAGVQLGMIVTLKDKDSRVVVPLKQSEAKSMLGVVVPASNATIVLSPDKVSGQQVLVASSGRHHVVLSSQNGPIKVGDYLTVSAISGIGMKASDSQELVIGQAAGNFTGQANVIGSLKLKDAQGKESSIALGLVPVDLKLASNPLFHKTSDYVPGFLAKIAVTVADKPVSVARIYLSLAILLVISVVAGSILYSGVKSGMLAVGRNPLSKKSIIRSLIETVIAGLIIFAAGVFAVYLLLKL